MWSGKSKDDNIDGRTRTMSENLTTAEKIRRLPWWVGANAANGVFVSLTLFGSFFVIFLSELGLDKTRIGLVLSLLPFTGVLAPFIGPWVERIGLKRVTMIGFGLRSVVAMGLLGTPWILTHYSQEAAFRWVIVIVLIFAFIRVVGLTSVFPWSQEIIPDHIRGKVGAINHIAMNLAAVSSVAGASYLIGRFHGLPAYRGGGSGVPGYGVLLYLSARRRSGWQFATWYRQFQRHA